MTTLRERLEAIQDRHRAVDTHSDATDPCINCGWDWPCPDHEDATVALEIIDVANRVTVRAAANWSPLDEFGQSVITAGPLVDLGVRLVPDPDPQDSHVEMPA